MSSKVNNGSCEFIYGSVVNVNKDSRDIGSSFVINISNCELPYIEDVQVHDIRIQSFHSSYYSILMGIAIIDELLVRYDKDYLNKNLSKLFKLYSSNSCIIKNIDMFRELLVYSSNTYYNECNKYANGFACGSLLHLDIITINLLRFIGLVREGLGINADFNFIINVSNGMSKLSLDTLVNFIKNKNGSGMTVNMIYNDIKVSQLTRLRTI